MLDFGYVLPKVTSRGVFKLWNDSDKPLEIVAVQPGCKCTTVNDLVGKSIPPRGSIDLEAQLDGVIATGSKVAEIKVLVDGFTGALNCRLRAEVTLPVRIVPGYINAVRGGPEKGTLTVDSVDKAPFRICSAGGFPPQFVGFDPEKDEPRNRYLLAYDLTKYPAGEIPRYWIVETDHPECAIADVLVRHDSVKLKAVVRGGKDLKVSGGLIEPGGSVELEVEFNKMAQAVEFTGIRSPTEDLKVEFLGTRVEGEGDDHTTIIKFKATPREGFTGIIYTPIILITADGREQETTFFAKVGPKGTCK